MIPLFELLISSSLIKTPFCKNSSQNSIAPDFISLIYSKHNLLSFLSEIIYNMPFGRETNRKMNIKIGKISNQEILKDIQDKKADSFEKLLTYAKKRIYRFYGWKYLQQHHGHMQDIKKQQNLLKNIILNL